MKVLMSVDGSLVVGTRRQWRKVVPRLLWAVFGEIRRVRARVIAGRDGTASAGVTMNSMH